MVKVSRPGSFKELTTIEIFMFFDIFADFRKILDGRKKYRGGGSGGLGCRFWRTPRKSEAPGGFRDLAVSGVAPKTMADNVSGWPLETYRELTGNFLPGSRGKFLDQDLGQKCLTG